MIPLLNLSPSSEGTKSPVSKGNPSSHAIHSSSFQHVYSQQLTSLDQKATQQGQSSQEKSGNGESLLIADEAKLKELLAKLETILEENLPLEADSLLAQLLSQLKQEENSNHLLEILLDDLGLNHNLEQLEEQEALASLLAAVATLANSDEPSSLIQLLQSLLAVQEDDGQFNLLTETQRSEGLHAGQILNPSTLSSVASSLQSTNSATEVNPVSFQHNSADWKTASISEATQNNRIESSQFNETLHRISPNFMSEGGSNESDQGSLQTRATHLQAIDNPFRQELASLTLSKTASEGESNSLVARYHSLVQDLHNILRMNIMHNQPGVLQQIKVKIHPQHLGEIDIQLISQEGKWTIQLLATSRLALEALDRNLYQLHAVLYQQGLQVERIEVAQQSTGSQLLHPGQDDTHHQPGQQNSESRPNSGRGAAQDNPQAQAERYISSELDELVTVDYTV